MNQENLYVPLSQDEKTERSIQLLIDAESGEIVEADEILDCGVDEKILIDMRHALKLAQRSGHYKYLCAFCEQGVQLVCRRSSSGKNIFFFSHFYKSDDCPVKTTTTQNPIEILKNKQNAFKESKMHKDMIFHMGECLALDSSFSKCSLYPDTYIKDTSVSVDFRRPDIVSYYSRDGKDAVPLIIELHLYTSLLSIILERDTFYREHKMNLLWIFPEFSPLNQRIGQKDIYYRNKRNVFVFDEDAYESSLKNKTLMLKCWWPIPVENDGKIVNEWHHKFISIRDLKFDSEIYEVYYHDSDKDFYENSNSELQSKINKWEEAIRVRTLHLKDSLEEKAMWVASQKEKLDRAEQIRRFRELLSMAERREITPEAYCDDATHLYGFRLGEFILVKPRFTKIGSWVDGIIPVKQAHWGAINYAGAKIIPFQYDIIGEFGEGVAVAKKDGKYGLIDSKGKIIAPNVYDGIGEFREGVAVAKKDGKYGLIDSKGKIIAPNVYDGIGEFRDGVAVVKKIGKYGLINTNGNIIVPCEYDKIEEFKDGVAIARKHGKCGYIDNKGNIVVPFEYDFISDFYENVALSQKGRLLFVIEKANMSIRPLRLGDSFKGVVTNKKEYGLFVRIGGSVTGLLHISNLKRFKLSLDDYKCGDAINVKIVTLDVNNRLSFAPYFPDSVYSGVVSDIKKYGVFVKVEHLGIGLIHKSELLKIGKSLDSFTLESAVNVKVLSQVKNRISFTLVE